MGNSHIIKKENNLLSNYPNIAKEWDYEKNYPLRPEMFTYGSKKEVWWHCNNGYPHSYPAKIQHRTLRNDGCSYCSSHRLLKGFNDLLTKREDIAKDWDYERNYPLTPSDVMPKERREVWWKCRNESHSYPMSLNNKSSGHGCPYCSNERVLTGFNDLAFKCPDILKEWDYSRNKILPQQVAYASHEMVWWLCPKYKHPFQARIYNRTKPNASTCPYCANKLVWAGFNDLQKVFPEIAKEWDYEKNLKKPTEYLPGSNDSVYWICPNGHNYKTVIHYRTSKDRTGCPYCNASKLEKLGNALLKKWNIDYKAEQKFNEYPIKHYPYDFYLMTLRAFIEFDGIQHFIDKDFFKDISFKERIRRDNLKNEYAFKHMLPLLRIPYIYDADKDKEKIAKLLKYFIKTRKIPQEIIDFYSKYEFSNYAELARDWNSKV